MTLTLPCIFPQVLSMEDPVSFSGGAEASALASTNTFLMNFLPDPQTGSVGFTDLIDGTPKTLNRRNGDSLRLSALAITFDAWRILNRLVMGSGASRDAIYRGMGQKYQYDLSLHSTKGDWKIQSYEPDASSSRAIAPSRFTDGALTPPLTGHVHLVHATGRFIDVSLTPALGLNLAVGWSSDGIEIAQCVYVDQEAVHTKGYYFSFDGLSLETLGLAALTETLASDGILFTKDLSLLASKASFSVFIRNDYPAETPFMRLKASLRDFLWDRAVRRLASQKLQ